MTQCYLIFMGCIRIGSINFKGLEFVNRVMIALIRAFPALRKSIVLFHHHFCNIFCNRVNDVWLASVFISMKYSKILRIQT